MANNNTFEVALFARNAKTEDGRTFTAYSARMVKKSTGEIVPVTVKFRTPCVGPKKEECPVFINVNREDANMAEREVIKEETGEVILRRTLWVTEYKLGREYIDTSLDDYM